MGGLVARSYTVWDTNRNGLDFYQNNVSKLLMIGPPHHGSEIGRRRGGDAGTLTFIDKYFRGNDPGAPANDDLSPGSQFVWELSNRGLHPYIEHLVVAGTKDFESSLLDAVHIEAKNHSDGAVAISSASLLQYGIPLGLVHLNHAEQIGTKANVSGAWLSLDNPQEAVILNRVARMIRAFVNGQPISPYVDTQINPGDTNFLKQSSNGIDLNSGILQAKIFDSNGREIEEKDFYLRPPTSINRSSLPQLRFNGEGKSYYYFDNTELDDNYFGKGIILPAGTTFEIVDGPAKFLPSQATSGLEFVLNPLETSMKEFYQLSTSNSSTLKDNSGDLSLTVPPGAASIQFLSIKQVHSGEAPKLPETSIGNIYDIGPNNTVFNPENLPTLTLHYRDVDLNGADESKLAIYTFNEQIGSWVPLPKPYDRDFSANSISAQIRHLSLFNLGIEQQGTSTQNTPPIALLTVFKTGDATFVFDASESFDSEDGNILERKIDFDGDGTFDIGYGNETKFKNTYTRSGIYTVVLSVRDSRGVEASVSVQVSVSLGKISLDLDSTPGDQGKRTTSSNLKTGDAIPVDLVVTQGALGAQGYEVILRFDPNALGFSDITPSDIFSGAVPITIKETGNVTLSVALLGKQATKDEGSLGQVTFTLLDGFEETTSVQLVSAQFGTQTGPQEIGISSGGAVVTINKADLPPSPDFDGDGTVGFSDFISFAGVFGSTQGDGIYRPEFDLDQDGTIDFSDFISFAQVFGTSG